MKQKKLWIFLVILIPIFCIIFINNHEHNTKTNLPLTASPIPAAEAMQKTDDAKHTQEPIKKEEVVDPEKLEIEAFFDKYVYIIYYAAWAASETAVAPHKKSVKKAARGYTPRGKKEELLLVYISVKPTYSDKIVYRH